MKRFLWYNITKLRNDSEYFIVSYISLITIQLPLYFSYFKNKNLLSSLIFAIIFSIFFIYITIMKKNFKILESIKKVFF